MKSNTNAILISIAAVIVAAGAYWYFFTGNSNEAPITQTGGGNAAQTQFQTLVGELSPISFDTSIFTDPRFVALTDLATPVSPEPTGRPDPFANIAGVSSK